MNQRLPIVVAAVYALALAITLILGSTSAFLIVAIIGGPVTGLAFVLTKKDRDTLGP